MKRLYFSFILSLFAFYTYAQQEQKLQSDSLAKFSADSLKSLATEYRYKNPLFAQKYATAYYRRVEKDNDEQKILDAAYLRAEVYNVLEKKDSAFYYVDIVIKQTKNIEDQRKYVNSLLLKGNICYDADLYEEASNIYTEVYKLVEKQNDIKKLADVRHNIALLKKELGLPKQAIELAKENWELYNQGLLDKNEQPTKYINTLLSLSYIYIDLSESFLEDKLHYLDSAEVYNDKGLQVSLKAKDLQAQSILLAMKGKIAQNRLDFEQAFLSFKETEELIRKKGFNNQLPLLYQFLGKNYFLSNDIDNAIKYLLKVDSIATQKKRNTPSLKETYILLAKSYEKKNDAKKASKYFKIFEEKGSKKDVLISKASQNLYKEYDIVTLKNKIESLVRRSKNEKLKSKTLIYVCLLLITIPLIGFWYYRKREQTAKKRFEDVLKELKSLEKEKNTITVKDKNLQSYTITDENIQKILDGLEKFEQKELFLQKKCTLNYVAKKINTNSTYLSKTLQSHKQKKFVPYITDLRLNYALTRLKNDTKFRTYDIKSIAAELGFNTAESFSKAFKKRTGIYPSFYIKNLNKIKD